MEELNEIVIGASNGRMVRFDENEVRIMGRNTSGVKAIDIPDDVATITLDFGEEVEIIPFSAEKGNGRDELVKLILDAVE